MTTRTITLLKNEVADYAEYLTSEGWPVISVTPVRRNEDDRYVEVTFAMSTAKKD